MKKRFRKNKFHLFQNKYCSFILENAMKIDFLEHGEWMSSHEFRVVKVLETNPQGFSITFSKVGETDTFEVSDIIPNFNSIKRAEEAFYLNKL